MTANQINYWNLQETGRHNRVTEDEIHRHNVATESIDLAKLSETTRSNKANEAIQSRRNDIQLQDNLANQDINLGRLAETTRTNQANEALYGYDLNIRDFQAQEQRRNNLVTEAVAKYEAKIKADKTQAETEYQQLVNKFYPLMNADKGGVTQAQKEEIYKQFELIDSQIERARRQNTVEAWNAVNNSIKAGADLAGAILGRR